MLDVMFHILYQCYAVSISAGKQVNVIMRYIDITCIYINDTINEKMEFHYVYLSGGIKPIT